MTDKLNFQLANKEDKTIIKKISKEDSSTPYNPIASESSKNIEDSKSSNIPPSPTAPPNQPNNMSESPEYKFVSKDESSTPIIL